MSSSAITRVAQFMSMCIAHRMCAEGVEDRSDLKRDDVAFHFMGSGASDMLTVGEILDFEASASQWLPKLEQQSVQLNSATWRAAERLGLVKTEDEAKTVDTDRVFQTFFETFDAQRELAVTKEAATVIQGRNEDMLTRALGGIAKLASIVQQIKTPDIAPAFALPPGLDIIHEVVRGAWHAMDNSEELGTGDLLIDRQFADDLNKALDNMQEAVIETEFEVGDAPHFVTQWRQKVEAIFLTFGWRTPEDGKPESMPQATGWYLVECEYQPVEGDIGYKGPGITSNWHELVYITVETDGYGEPVDLDVNREDKWKFSHQLGELEWNDVLRYAMIPCMPYRQPGVENAPDDRQIDLFGGDHTD